MGGGKLKVVVVAGVVVAVAVEARWITKIAGAAAGSSGCSCKLRGPHK